MRIRRRRPLASKEIKSLRDALSRALSQSQLDVVLAGHLETASTEKYSVILSGKEPVVFEPDGTPFPTLRGFLRVEVQHCYLQVDSGAVPFIANGANVMAPGVVRSDATLRQGDLCVVTEERHNKPLCIARMIVNASEIDRAKKGKVADSIHHVGDALWKLSVE